MKSQSEAGTKARPLFRILDSGFKMDGDQKKGWLKEPDPGAANLLPVGSAAFDAAEFVKMAMPHVMTCQLTADEKTALSKSISAHGITEEVIMDITGSIIDGYHRVLIACEILLSEKRIIDVPYKIVEFSDAAAEAEFVTIRHAVRRHLTTAQRVAMAEGLLRAGHTGTNAYIALMVGLSANTVKKYRIALENREEITVSNSTLDKRGRIHKRREKTDNPEKTQDSKGQIDFITETEAANDVKLVAAELTDAKPDQRVPDNADGSPPVTLVEEAPEASVTPNLDVGAGLHNVPELPEGSTDNLLHTLLSFWWMHLGIEPVTCTDIDAAVKEAAPSDADLVALTSSSTKLGKYLAKIASTQVCGYFVQMRILGSGKIYFIRPSHWNINGPVN